jgi:hypothetical protein
MPQTAAEARSKRLLPPGTNVARFNKPGREQPKSGSGNGSASIKPRLAKHGYVKFLTLADLDARCRAAAFAKHLAESLESDLGGDPSTAQKTLTERAAVVTAICQDFETRFLLGEAIELSDYLTATNVLRRVLATLGLERRQRQVNGLSLGDLMRLDIEERRQEAAEAVVVTSGDCDGIYGRRLRRHERA